MRLGSGRDIFVHSRYPTKVAGANPNRKMLTVWSGEYDIWIGGPDVEAGTVAGRGVAGGNVNTRNKGEVWAIRRIGEDAKCGLQMEFEDA